ncbi:Scn11a [Symbiodinium microadriaticum]|nr:Scn11a [Symbiodinium microadriaticum]
MDRGRPEFQQSWSGRPRTKLAQTKLQSVVAHASESQLLKKLTNRISDFESQVASQIQTLTQDVDKKVSFMGSRRPGGEEVPGVESLARDVDAVKYDVGELKDLLNGAKHDTDHVKRIVLACERDMEDFTAAMDAVNVDLDEMRARVDSTHSIITSRQRVEATVTAEISTMRLDMGDMQEALKAHDAWMEDVSQSLQEAHERCQQIGLDINDVNQQMQVKLDAKTDIVSWNDMNDDIDASIRTVRDMASSLRFEVDNRRRRVDEELARLRSEMTSMDERVMAKTGDIQRQADEKHAAVSGRLEEGAQHRRELEATLGRHAETHNLIQGQINGQRDELDTRLGFLESSMKKQGEELQKSAHDRMDGMERHQSTIAKESGKHLNALDLRMAALQGASGESKRDINKIRDEVNSLTVKSAAHDVDIAKNSDDLRKLERQKAEDGQRQKQEFDAIYDELDQFAYRSFIVLIVASAASLSVSKNPARLLSHLTFTQTDHLKNALEAIKSRRYTRAYTKKPWMDDDGNQIWSNLRVKVAQTVFSQYFETFMGLIIIFNICLIIYEANQDAQCHPEYTDNWDECPFRGELLPLLGVGNYVLLVLYSIESCARAFAERERFLCNVWNVIDLVTVLLGWMSLLLQNIINPNLLRLSRLVRVLRAARVFISIPEFYLLVSGLYSSFKAIIFGSFMLLSTIVVWAIIAVEVLHPVTAKLTFASEFCQGRECQLRFRSVYSAGLTLFQQVVAGDSWGEISIPLLEEHPETSFVLFPIMVSISLGVMNLILAVIVERATEARENDQDRKLKKKDQERSKNMIEFAMLCDDMDADGSGSLSLDEMLKGYDNIEAFSRLMQIMDIRREDMETIFHVLDSDLSGEVSYFEFCQHLSGFFERDPTIMQSLIKYSVMELRKVINSDVVEALRRQTDVLDHQTRLLEVMMPAVTKMQNPAPSMPTPPTVPQPEEPWTLEFWRSRHVKAEGTPTGPVEPLGSIHQQLRPLIARAEELVLEALEQRDEQILGLAESQASEKLPGKARPKKMERPTSTDSLKEPRELVTLCESFQHRLNEIETLEERCRDVVRYLKSAQAHTAGSTKVSPLVSEEL